jgi:hypothetical protein
MILQEHGMLEAEHSSNQLNLLPHSCFSGISGCQGLNLPRLQPGSMKAGLLCEHFYKIIVTIDPLTFIHHTYWTSVANFEVLNRHPVCRWLCSLQMSSIKFMQIEMVSMTVIIWGCR